MNVYERLIKALNCKNDAELARKLGVTTQAVNKAKSIDKVPPAWVLKVADEVNISTDWLFFGLEKNCDNLDKSIKNTALVRIPIVVAKLSAGKGSLETDKNIEEYINFEKNFISKLGNPKNMVIFKVSGDSMSPEIKDKDLVIIDENKKEIYPSYMYAVSFEDAIYVKRIEIEPGKIILKSVNKDYEPLIFDVRGYEDNFRVIGKIIFIMRTY